MRDRSRSPLPRAGNHKNGGLIRLGIRGIAGGIGLASESIKAHKEKKEAAAASRGHEAGSSSTLHPQSAEQSSGLAYNRDDNDPPPDYAPPGYTPSAEYTPPADHKPSAKYQGSQYPDEKGKVRDKSSSGGSRNVKHGDDHHGEDEDYEPEHDLEDEWNLDDAQDEIFPTELPEREPSKDSRPLEDIFIANHPPPQKFGGQAPRGSLTLPVLIPQRRPKERSRGFIRAYAPLLENCGIDQPTWLEFLDTFQKSSAANPWLNAINLASIASAFLPLGFGQLVGYAINQVANMAIELQARERTNKFLFKINEEFFRPRGLYALVMTWNPESSRRFEEVSLSNAVGREERAHGAAGLHERYRASDGQSYGEWEFPEVAPLVFPALDKLAAQADAGSAEEGKKQNKMADKMRFVGEYWDKRATADYAMKNPKSVLSQVPQGRFTSRYADPNNHASSGSLISFVSGGKLIPGPNSRGLIGGIASVVGQAVKGEEQGSEWKRQTAGQQQWNHGRYLDPAYANRYTRGYTGKERRRMRMDERRHRDGLISTPLRAYRHALKKNVMYLLVVNLPSDEEMAAAKIAVDGHPGH